MTPHKFTPGPWGIERTKDTNWIGPLKNIGTPMEKNDVLVCHTDRESLKEDYLAESDANATLIAAAPSLLEALEEIARAHPDGNPARLIALAGEAVRKATNP